jgi:hypothetical protein
MLNITAWPLIGQYAFYFLPNLLHMKLPYLPEKFLWGLHRGVSTENSAYGKH